MRPGRPGYNGSMSERNEAAPAVLAEELRAAREEIEQLKVGLETRSGIGVAQGMLMLRYGISQVTAFDYLARRSQDENVKLHDLARGVVAELGAVRWPDEGAKDLAATSPDEEP